MAVYIATYTVAICVTIRVDAYNTYVARLAILLIELIIIINDIILLWCSDGANRATDTLMYQHILNGMFNCFSMLVKIVPRHTETQRYGM